jgi:hypothetical protein
MAQHASFASWTHALPSRMCETYSFDVKTYFGGPPAAVASEFNGSDTEALTPSQRETRQSTSIASIRRSLRLDRNLKEAKTTLIDRKSATISSVLVSRIRRIQNTCSTTSDSNHVSSHLVDDMLHLLVATESDSDPFRSLTEENHDSVLKLSVTGPPNRSQNRTARNRAGACLSILKHRVLRPK